MDTSLTVAEVAELLKVNEQTVRNWTNLDRGAGERTGQRVRATRA
jgi:excisionase family DNA binding protein